MGHPQHSNMRSKSITSVFENILHDSSHTSLRLWVHLNSLGERLVTKNFFSHQKTGEAGDLFSINTIGHMKEKQLSFPLRLG